jgi:hypothetical protein
MFFIIKKLHGKILMLPQNQITCVQKVKNSPVVKKRNFCRTLKFASPNQLGNSNDFGLKFYPAPQCSTSFSRPTVQCNDFSDFAQLQQVPHHIVFHVKNSLNVLYV